uniref:Large ribosomal subunit protein mL52 n=1 Tax=Oncorhynchus tshawytscha TaxID=74940 RepID=A0AAZ3P0S2_ONCTS
NESHLCETILCILGPTVGRLILPTPKPRLFSLDSFIGLAVASTETHWLRCVPGSCSLELTRAFVVGEWGLVLVKTILPCKSNMAAPLRTLCSTDGRSAPPLKGQLRRKQERETLARRVVNLSPEVDKGMEVWREKREEAKRIEERNKSLLLKPKGNLLLKKNK